MFSQQRPGVIGDTSVGPPLPARVIATGSAGDQYTVRAGRSGRFTMMLPTGAYNLAGYSPVVHVGRAEQRCFAAHPVYVRAGQTTRDMKVVWSIR